MTSDSRSPVAIAERVLPVLRAQAAEIDLSAEFPEVGLQTLRESGLLGLLVPVEFGGLGGDLGDLVEVAQCLSGGCLSTAMIWAMHCQQSDVLVRFGSHKLKEWVLPRIADGQLYLASVTTESGKGGHLLTNQTPLQKSDESILVEREAPIVTGGVNADGYLITMRACVDALESEVSIVFADRTQLDVVPTGKWQSLGMRGTNSVGLKLSGVVPDWQIVGAPGKFRDIAIESMAPVGHLAWSACWLGAARSALGGLVSLIRSPSKPRSIDVSSELFSERMAQIRMDLELVGAYLSRVRDEIISIRNTGGTVGQAATQIHLNTLKVKSSDLTFQAVDRMIQLSGLNVGYRNGTELPLERCFRDLRSASLNYSNDRLLTASGALTLMDREVRLA